LFKLERNYVDFDFINGLDSQSPARSIHVLDPMRKPESRCLSEIASTNAIPRLIVFIQQICPHDIARVAVEE
jgi:hypothetical protein